MKNSTREIIGQICTPPLKIVTYLLAVSLASTAGAWDTPLSVEAGQTYTLSGDETYDQLIVNEESVIELNGHNLTIKGAFSPSSTADHRAIITNSVASAAAKMTFTLTQGIGSQEFTKVQFGGNLALEVSANFSASTFVNDVDNTHTGGTTLKNITGNQNPRINTAKGLGEGPVVFGENSNIRDVSGSAYTYSWTSLTSKGACTNYFYMERNHSIGAIPVVVEKGNTFALSDLRNGLGDWNSADYSGVVGTFWVNGNGGGIVAFCPDIPNGVLMLSGKEIRNGTHVTDGYVWRIGAIASPASATANDTGALLRRVDGTGGKVTVEVGSANVDTTWYGQFIYDNNNNKDWNIKKVGTGTWTIGGVNYYHGTTEIADGAILLIAGGELGDSVTAPDINLTGGALLLGTGVTHNPLARVKTPNAGVPARLGSPAGNSYTVDHSLSGITQGITKVGGGTLTLTSTAMDFTGAVTVEEGTLELPADAVLATAATVKENGKLKIGDQVFQYKVGHTGDVTVRYENGQYVAEQELIDGYVAWTGAADTDWNNSNNWEGGVVPSDDCGAAEPTATSVIFDSDATVTISADTTIRGALIVNGTLTLTTMGENGNYTLNVAGTDGIGMIVLSDAQIANGSQVQSGVDKHGAAATFAANMEAAGTKQNAVTGYDATLDFTGNLSGTGTITMIGWRPGGAVQLSGDNSGFSGTFVWGADVNNGTKFATETAGSENAEWEFYTTQKKEVVVKAFAGDTLKFGAFRNNRRLADAAYMRFFQDSPRPITVEIGNLNREDDLIGLTFGDTGKAYVRLRKVGTGTLEVYGGRHNYGTEINGGRLVASHEASLSGNNMNDSAYIAFNGGTLVYGSYNGATVATDWSKIVKNSTAAIKVETTGTDVTWATALGDSNEVHEIVKTGTGDLIITAVPTWETTKVTVGFDSKGSVLLPADAPYELGADGIHTTRVSAVTINNVEYNKFTNPMGLTIIFR